MPPVRQRTRCQGKSGSPRGQGLQLRIPSGHVPDFEVRAWPTNITCFSMAANLRNSGESSLQPFVERVFPRQIRSMSRFYALAVIQTGEGHHLVAIGSHARSTGTSKAPFRMRGEDELALCGRSQPVAMLDRHRRRPFTSRLNSDAPETRSMALLCAALAPCQCAGRGMPHAQPLVFRFPVVRQWWRDFKTKHERQQPSASCSSAKRGAKTLSAPQIPQNPLFTTCGHYGKQNPRSSGPRFFLYLSGTYADFRNQNPWWKTPLIIKGWGLN